MVSGLNPKALLLCLALLPQFTRSTAAWPVAVQIGALGAIQIVNCALVYSLVGVGAGLVLRRRPRLPVLRSRSLAPRLPRPDAKRKWSR